MDDYYLLLIFWGGVVILGVISWLVKSISNSQKYLALKSELDSMRSTIKSHEVKAEMDKKEYEAKVEKNKEEWKRRADKWSREVKKDREGMEAKAAKWRKQIDKDKQEIRKIARQKSMGFPWLAEAYADYFSLKDGEIEKYLINKNHPALKAAEIVKSIKNEKRELVKESRLINYKINYYEKLFPWLSELIAEDEDEEMPVRIEYGTKDDGNQDRVRDLLTAEEYKSLPSVERNQMALDRYLRNRNKSKWAIGRDYEMYVGYLYAQKGYSIEYKGIVDGFEDLGRDVIAKKGDEVCIIQCKRWAYFKKIHEKHIFQLFGTTMEYWVENYKNQEKPKSFELFANLLNDYKLRSIFFTSTSLSVKSREMANALGVEIIENEPLGEFPRIKCNINNDEFGETRIYHLPMDQQYDRTIIGDRSGEFYAFTVKEAEDAGFRRAFKHRF